jgi:hypothetical protein
MFQQVNFLNLPYFYNFFRPKAKFSICLDLKGSGSQIELAKRIAKKLLKARALKVGLFSIFATAGIQYFESEIEALLVYDVFKHLCGQKVDGKLKVVCDIIQAHDLDLHTKSMKSLISSNNLGREEKIFLLKRCQP